MRIRFVKYLRELSLVVLGIIITFGGAYLIELKSNKKELHNLLNLLHQELVVNLTIIDDLQNAIENEIDLYARLKVDNFVIGSIEEMDIKSFLDEITILRSFKVQDAAFSVFKLSKQMQERNNILLLESLVRTYQNLNYLTDKIESFYLNKERVFRLQIEGTSMNEWKNVTSLSDNDYSEFLFSNVAIRNFVWSAPEHFKDEDILLTRIDILTTLEIIETTRGFKLLGSERFD